MPMNGEVLAREALAAMGGQVSDVRSKAFRALCDAIVQHIQLYAAVTVTVPGVTAGPTAVVGVGAPGTAIN